MPVEQKTLPPSRAALAEVLLSVTGPVHYRMVSTMRNLTSPDFIFR